MPFTETDLQILAQQHLNCGDAAFTPIATGLFNTSFFVHTNEQDYVLRIAPPSDTVFLFYERNMMRQEPAIHKRVAEQTDVPIPAVIAFDTSHRLIPHDYLLLERLPGYTLTDAPSYDQDNVLRQIGAHLRNVHEITASRYGCIGAHQPMRPQASWAAAFRVLWGKLLDDITAIGHYTPDENTLLKTLLDDHLAYFDRDIPASLLHMDIWQQNILIDETGTVSGLLDWDRALWGDPEMEFAVLDYCGLSRPAFWEGYGRKRENTQASQIRQAFYYLYELQKYIVIEQGRKNNPTTAHSYKQHAMQILQRTFSLYQK